MYSKLLNFDLSVRYLAQFIQDLVIFIVMPNKPYTTNYFLFETKGLNSALYSTESGHSTLCDLYKISEIFVYNSFVVAVFLFDKYTNLSNISETIGNCRVKKYIRKSGFRNIKVTLCDLQ